MGVAIWYENLDSSLSELSYTNFLVISLSSLQEQFSRLLEGHSNVFFGCQLLFIPFCQDDPTWCALWGGQSMTDDAFLCVLGITVMQQ